MIYVTAAGLLFLPLAWLVTTLATRWLPALLLASAAFQATSVLDVDVGAESYGVSPYALICLCAGATLVVRCVRDRGLRMARPCSPALGWLTAYMLLALLGSMLLPLCFAGLPVYTPLSRWGFDVDPVPLQFGLSNAAQALNLCLHGVALLFLLQAAQRADWRSNRIAIGLAAGLGAALLIMGYEWAAHLGLWPSSERLWLSNPGYNQALSEQFMGTRRIFAPFSEPSYASTWLAAALTGLIAVLLAGRRWLAALLFATAVGLALIGTFGTTGWVAAAACFVLLVAMATARALSGGASRQLARRTWLVWGLLATSSVALFAAASSSGTLPRWQALAEQAVFAKVTSESGQFRSRSNRHALNLVRETWGAGVGLGSNRASSYFASLASNVGIAGVLLWLATLISLARRYLGAAELDDTQLAVAGALLGGTVAVGVGVPDLNFPAYWALLFGTLLLAPTDRANDTGRA